VFCPAQYAEFSKDSLPCISKIEDNVEDGIDGDFCSMYFLEESWMEYARSWI
jgi:hypothetical protein